MTKNNRSVLINSMLSLVLVMTVSTTAWSNDHGHAEQQTDAMSLINAYIVNFVKVFNQGDAAKITALYRRCYLVHIWAS